MLMKPPNRTSDKWGQGHFGAPRGSRTHKGIDFACHPGTAICAEMFGIVTKIGYPYDDDEDHDGKPDFTYVEIKDPRGSKARYFYVDPCVKVGDIIPTGQVIGITQRLGGKYPDITEHLHFEVKDKNGVFIDPSDYLGKRN